MDWILERCGSCWISMFHCYVRLSKATSLQTCRFYVRTIYSTFSKHGCKKDGGKLPSIFTEAARGVGQRIVYGSSMGGPCATSTLEKLCTTHLQMVLRYTLIIYIYIIYLIIQFIPQDQLLFPPWTIEEKLMSHWMNQWIDFLILKPHGWPHPVVKCYWYYLKN